jgi:hypothetical protein
MAAVAGVARCHERAVRLAPGRDDAVDRLGREVRPVGEHDDGRLDVGPERSERAAQ